MQPTYFHIFAYFDNIFDNNKNPGQIFVQISWRYTSNYVLSTLSTSMNIICICCILCV